VYVGSDGLHPSFLIVSHVLLACLLCIGRPKASAWLSAKQRTFFNEKKMEVEAARRLLVPDRKQEVINENQEDNAEEAKVDVPNETEEETDGNEEKVAISEESRVHVQNETEEEMDGKEEKEANSEKARLEVQSELAEEMDDDVSRKDSFYDTEEDDDKVAHFLIPRASVELFLFIAVVVGLVVTWYLSKLQRRRSGLHKKLDVAAVYRPVCAELSYC
jgi:hypothetical protein